MTLINKPLLFLRMETIKMKQTVRLKKLREDAIIPAYGTEFAAGADLYACMDKDITINPAAQNLYTQELHLRFQQALSVLFMQEAEWLVNVDLLRQIK